MNMSKNIFLIGLFISIIFISGCIQQKRSTFESDIQQTSTKTGQPIKIPQSPTKLGTSGAPAPPADQVLTEITIISQNNNEWKIKVDKIRDYIRYPNAKNPELKEGEEVAVQLNSFLDTFEFRGPVCPSGYVKSPKPAGAQPTGGERSTRPTPKIIAGDKYLSKLLGCFAELNCEKLGWSGYLYNPSPIIVEHECVIPDSTKPPSTETGQYPSVEPQK